MSIGTVTVDPDSNQVSGWMPTVGPETLALLDRSGVTNEFDRATLRDEAVAILGACISPKRRATPSTGLAFGNVQSGKTLSFTVVTALARDNGFGMVIVVAGSSIPLYRQSCRRLEKDLLLGERDDRAWVQMGNPRRDEAPRLATLIKDWREDGRTILLTAMKNHAHLGNLAELLELLDLHGMPVLVIDDEADQASMNTRASRQQQSTTYSALLRLKQAVPHHSYLQYTATPQAPLLINLIDTLSPEFAKVLTPGTGYTGGTVFFRDRKDLVVVIPDDQLPQDGAAEPPQSLMEALRIFLLGITEAYQRTGGRMPPKNRSMLVHPSAEVAPHSDYYRWISATLDNFKEALRLPATDPDRVDVLADFQLDYEKLRRTTSSLPGFAELIPFLLKAVEKAVVTVVNAAAGTTPAVPFRDHYAHILIGGQAMDRGFTVEGLTVTYMPRRVGVGNVDTIQQRARFFGYKKEYIGLCRVYLESAARVAYTSYVDHEESMRSELRRHGDRPLAEWKRAFLLDRKYHPTRRSVLGFDFEQGDYAGKWFKPNEPQLDPAAVLANNAVISAFETGLDWVDDEGDDRRTDVQRHKVASCAAQAVVANLLVPLRLVAPADSTEMTGLILQAQNYLDDHASARAAVYLMSSGRRRERGVDPNTRWVVNLHQGRNPASGYPGDSKVQTVDLMSVQIHHLLVEGAQVDTIAVWLPSDMKIGFLVAV